MKKVLSMIAALLLCVETQAQIISSRNTVVRTEKQASNTQWFLCAGLNIMNFSGDGVERADSNTEYSAIFGYQKPLGSTGGYWGVKFGLGSRGFKAEDTRYMAHNIQYPPFTFGWKFTVADNVHINPHVGVLASYGYMSKMKADGESISWKGYADCMEVNYNHFDAGVDIGVGVWYDRFNLDLTYQHGLMDTFNDADGFKTNNFMIRLGIAF